MQRTGTNGRRIIKLILLFILLSLLVFFDQISKHLIKTYCTEDIIVIENFFSLISRFNTGAAWSFLAGKSWAQPFFIVLTFISLIIILLFYLYANKKGYKLVKIALILVSAGAIGNLIDRLRMGGVVDFLSFKFGNYYFPTFNLADSFITIGIILVVIHLLFLDENALFKKHAK